MSQAYVYILTNKPFGTLYTGVTTNLYKRLRIHKLKKNKGTFVGRCKLCMLVYSQEFPSIYYAIRAEKNIKAWNRAWKIALIVKHNPKWIDLSNSVPSCFH